jgi:hypothetical protein
MSDLTIKEAPGARRRSWQIHCLGKRAYVSRGEANRAKAILKRVASLQVYKCRSCGKYHLGHEDKDVQD